MKALVLYRPNSEFASGVESFVHDLQQQDVDEKQLQIVDYDSREGGALASLYDLMTQPAIVVIADDGGYVKHWEGTNLPRAQEVAGYLFSYH